MGEKKTKNKLVYTMSEVSRRTKLPLKTIELWEKELYFLNAGRTSKGKRIFRKRDLDIIIRLKQLKKEGLTLAGAKRKIESEFNIRGAAPMHPDRLKKVLFQIKEQLTDIASTLEK